jgi:cyclic-di-GMP-binding biofilm dispersal mediator protein
VAGRRDLDGAVVAVLGATGGLGRPICAELEARNASVVRVNRSGEGADVRLDLRDGSAGEVLVSAVRDRYDRLDGVVNAAGIVAFGDLADTDDVVVEELFLTNAMGPLWIARAVLPLLIDSRGFFANISGVVASTPMPAMAAYCASKAAAAAGFQALRKEVRRSKVQVIDLQPPHTETGLADHPLAGTAPSMPTGLAPETVAARVVVAIEQNEAIVTADQFGDE